MDILSLIPTTGNFLWIVLFFVVALSIIVAIHEYGHYIVGRWCGIHADVFSLGFGPVLWSRPDKRGTVWQIAALPFGGYVKFAGDANAASGKDDAAIEAVAENPAGLRRTMHGAPLWARSLTVAAGPVFNFILSMLIFGGLAMSQGKDRDPLTVGALTPMPEMVQGLQPGDEVLGVEGTALPLPAGTTRDEFLAFSTGLPEALSHSYDVRRGGTELTVEGPHFAPAITGAVIPLSAASDAGLKAGDVITAVDGARIFSFQALKDKVEAADGRALLLDAWRDGETMQFTLVPKVTDEPQADGSFIKVLRIGIQSGSSFESARENIGLGQAAETGARRVWAIISGTFSSLGPLVTGQISSCNMSGPIGIAQTSGAVAAQGMAEFINFIAVLSTAVGLLNLFPIPALDGGHLMFYAYEAVARRKPSDRALKVLMSIGITLVLSLMLFALFNDIFCP
ncbi:MAG: RIP metalloprotease RseP [Sulfitobacter sp.]